MDSPEGNIDIELEGLNYINLTEDMSKLIIMDINMLTKMFEQTKLTRYIHDHDNRAYVHEEIQHIAHRDITDRHYNTKHKFNRPNVSDDGDYIHGHTQEVHGGHEVHEDIQSIVLTDRADIY